MIKGARFGLTIAGFVALIVLGETPASAQAVIYEIHVVYSSGYPGGSAEQIVIYGTGFADSQTVFLGSQKTPLNIPTDQSLCLAAPPPPIDSASTDCVVAELPFPIPYGDYLVSIEGEVPPAGCSDGKPVALMFKYTGEACDSSLDNLQEGKFRCTGDPAYHDPVEVSCDDVDCIVDPNDLSVTLGSTVVLSSNSSKLKSDTDIEIRSASGSLLQDLRIHTSRVLRMDFGSAGRPAWTKVATLGITGVVRGLEISAGYLYIADKRGALRTVDISSPEKPKAAGYVQVSGTIRGLAVKGRYAYLTAGWEGLAVVDVADAQHPKVLHFYKSAGYATNVRVIGSLAFVLNLQRGLRVIDISSPLQPRELLCIRAHLVWHFGRVKGMKKLMSTSIKHFR